MPKPYLLTNDLLFNKVLANPTHSLFLRDFVNTVLELNFEEVTVDSPYDWKAYKERFDAEQNEEEHYPKVIVTGTTEDGVKAKIQLIAYETFVNERALYHNSVHVRTTPPEEHCYTIAIVNTFTRGRGRYTFVNREENIEWLDDDGLPVFLIGLISLDGQLDNDFLKHTQHLFSGKESCEGEPEYFAQLRESVNIDKLSDEERTYLELSEQRATKMKAFDEELAAKLSAQE